MSEQKSNTFIFTPVRTDMIERCLETLYKHTPDNFYVIVVDQTKHGIDQNLRDRYKNLTYLRTPITDTHRTGNLGFSKANNLAFKLVETPYFTMCNDDVEFINKKWWSGIMETFEKLEKLSEEYDNINPPVMVNPSSTKLPDWSVGRPKGDDHYIIPYRENYSEDDYEVLMKASHYVNERLTLMPGSVIDGVTMYCSVFDTERFKKIGLLNEKFYPGGGEDYDWNCRANMVGYRSVGTTNSWVFHHWSKTMGQLESEQVKSLIQDDLKWNNNNELWGEGFDVWGMKDKEAPPIEIREL